MTTRVGVHTAWLVETHSQARSTARRTWRAIAESPDWASWLDAHVWPAGIDTVANFEDRASERMMIRGDTLHAYIPMNDVRAAAEARTLPRYMAELYGRIYAKWAEKRGWPPPPQIVVDVEKSLPSRFP